MEIIREEGGMWEPFRFTSFAAVKVGGLVFDAILFKKLRFPFRYHRVLCEGEPMIERIEAWWDSLIENYPIHLIVLGFVIGLLL